jgi:arginyl-tRNA synthetase
MKEKIASLLKIHVPISIEEILSSLEIPKDEKLGDFAFPCFSLAKHLKKNPVEIAKDIANKIKSTDFEKIEAVGPYVNFFVNRKLLSDQVIRKILKEKDKYGSIKEKEKILIEFSQPNTHKAFHVGHIRGTSIGESIARIYEFTGKEVIRANYSGDTGMHIAKWIWCYQNYHKGEKLNNDESWIAGIYVDAIKRLAENPDYQSQVEEINRKIETKEDKKINELWKKTRKLSIDSWKQIYKQLHTHFDVHYFESQVEIPGKKISNDLLKKDIAKLSDEAVIMDLKEYNLGVWVLLRRDGTVLYSAKDIALAVRKTEEHKADKYLVVVGDEQKLHFEQLLKTLEIMGLNKQDKYNFLTFGMVRLPTGKMSSRTGDNVLYSDFINEMKNHLLLEIKKREPKISKSKAELRAIEISIAAIKYAMLKQDPNKTIIFSKEEALKFEGDTGPYLLYSYARAKSILKKAKYSGANYKFNNMNEFEKLLVNKLSIFPEVVNNSMQNIAPNLIANYSFELCQIFNEFYHANQVIGSIDESFRLALVQSFSIVLKNSLNLLGINVIEKM